MAAKLRMGLAVFGVLAFGVVPAANAWPPFPPFQCPWHEDRDCPCSHYCCLHYWAPVIYRIRAYHTDPRYVYGCPFDSSVVGYRIDTYPCRVTSPSEQSARYDQEGHQLGWPGPNPSAQPQAQPPTPPPAAPAQRSK